MATDLDKTFNSPNGYDIIDFSPSQSQSIPSNNGTSVVLQPDGKILFGGYSFNPDTLTNVLSLTRYKSDGFIDVSFGTNGDALFSTIIPSNIVCNYITLQKDGKILACGYENSIASPNSSNIIVYRITENGLLDTSFGEAKGYVITIPSSFNKDGLIFDSCQASSLAIQNSDNKIVVCGSVKTSITNNSYYALVRYNTDGTIDQPFGPLANSFSNLDDEFGISIAIQSDGKIVLAGNSIQISTNTNTNSNFTVVRFNSNGSVDTTFGSNGAKSLPYFISSSHDIVSSLKIQPDGYIVLAGTTNIMIGQLSYSYYAITRVDTSGNIDSTFGEYGKVITSLSSSSIDLNCNTMELQEDNKIVLAGSFTNTLTNKTSFSLARYNSNGTLDSTFGIKKNGLIIENIIPNSTSNEICKSIAIQSDGKIILGGTTRQQILNNNISYFILARYLEKHSSTPNPPKLEIGNIPIASICFPAGTPVLTDQGNIDIEKINPEFHTIHKKPIIALTQSFSNDNNIVCIQKNSLALNIPNKTTYISNYHGIVYKNKLIPANQFVGRFKGINFVEYNNEILYNILMEKHYIININNMRVETLNPKNIVAKLYSEPHSPEEKTKLILEINETSRNNKNNLEKNNYNKYTTNNVTRRKFSVLKFNPLISRLNYHTKKHFLIQPSQRYHTSKQRVSNLKNSNFKLRNYKFIRSFRKRR